MRERLRGLAAPAVIFLIGLWLTSNAWGPQPPSGDDVMGLVVRTEEGLRILTSGHLDGWSPRFLTGFPEFLHYGQGLALAAGALRLVTFGLLSVTGAIGVLAVLATALLGPATWFFARSLGMTNRASFIAGVCALAVNSPFGLGLKGLYEIGLLTHSLAAPFLLLGLGALLRGIATGRRRWAVVMAASLGFVVVTHVISTLIGLILCAVLVPAAVMKASPTDRRKGVTTAVLGGLGALGLSAVWWIPYLAHFDERGIVTGWTTPSLSARIDEVLTGRILFAHWVALFVIAGIAWALLRVHRGQTLPAASVAAAIVLLVLAHWIAKRQSPPELSLVLANRGLGYVGLLCIVPLGGFVDDVLRIPAWRRATDVVSGLLAAAIVVVPSPRLAEIPKQQKVVIEPMHAVAERLKASVPRGARFATERNLNTEVFTLGVSHADLWLAAKSRRSTLDTFNIELSQSPDAGRYADLLQNDPQNEVTARRLALFGVTHVVTIHSATKERLLRTGEFDLRLESAPMAVLAVRPPNGVAQPASLFSAASEASAKAAEVSGDFEHYVIDVHVAQRTNASVALGYSSYWRVKVDGQSVPVTKSPDGLVGFEVPEGRHTISVDYERDPWNAVGLLISLATAVALVLWARRIRWRAAVSRLRP